MGCGICASLMPTAWQMNPVDGKADLSDSELKKDHYFRKLWLDETKKMQEVQQMCPVKAIKII